MLKTEFTDPILGKIVFWQDSTPTKWTYPGDTVLIGTCSKCSGPVTVPAYWYGTDAPVPRCSSCGATKKQSYGPVIDME